MIKLLNDILQTKEVSVKSHLTSPFPNYRLVLKRDAWESAKRAKGWKTYQDGANAMRLTRQSIQMADKTRVQVGPEFITRWVACMGNINGNWWTHFEIVPYGVYDQNHPIWNEVKTKGVVPYTKYSAAAIHRSNCYSVEKS